MLPTEGEQLSRQDRGAAGRASDFADVVLDLAFHAELIEKQIAVAKNCRKKIVKIVCNPSRELTKRLHLLRTNELVLQLFSRGHVHERTDEANGLARGIADD